jgi:hypothetical protein
MGHFKLSYLVLSSLFFFAQAHAANFPVIKDASNPPEVKVDLNKKKNIVLDLKMPQGFAYVGILQPTNVLAFVPQDEVATKDKATRKINFVQLDMSSKTPLDKAKSSLKDYVQKHCPSFNENPEGTETIFHEEKASELDGYHLLEFAMSCPLPQKNEELIYARFYVGKNGNSEILYRQNKEDKDIKVLLDDMKKFVDSFVQIHQ